MMKKFRYDDVPVLETTSGKLKGYFYDGAYIFKGVPYAHADRFQMPVPSKWEGVKDATSYGFVCPLTEQDTPSAELLVPHRYWPMDEHCQNLNIWTKVLDKNAKKPVIVWLHGGGYFAGSSIEQVAYDGYNMCMEGDTVVVSINHRLNILGYLDVPSSGVYLLDGVDNSAASDEEMARIRNESIGFVFQTFHLLPRQRAWENVALPLSFRGVPRKDRRELAAEALDRVGLLDRLDFYPDQLSGGQCQRVAIARAICTSPKLLLADEPTGALDSKSGLQIMEIFDGLHDEGATIIMITHEMGVAKRAGRVMHIRDGMLTDGVFSAHTAGGDIK